MTQFPSINSPFVCKLARSLPAFGSEYPWHQIISPSKVGFMNCNFCSSVPNSNKVGTNISIPCPPIAEGMFDFENSVANILLLIISASPPKPPYFLGTDLAKYPLLIKIDCHSDRDTVFPLFFDA